MDTSVDPVSMTEDQLLREMQPACRRHQPGGTSVHQGSIMLLRMA